MKRILPLVLALAGCGSGPSSNVKVIVGAQVPSKGIEYSVVIVEGSTIREVGLQADVPVPKGVPITSGLGKILEPAAGSAIEAGQPATFVLRDAKSAALETMVEGAWK